MVASQGEKQASGAWRNGLCASRAKRGAEAFQFCRAFYIRTIDLIPQISGC